MNNDSTFTSPLIKSFQTDDKIENNTKKIRYHYTSPSAFLSIIENQRVHFTDIRYLNDKSEGIYLIKLIIEFFENHKKDLTSFQKYAFQDVFSPRKKDRRLSYRMV